MSLSDVVPILAALLDDAGGSKGRLSTMTTESYSPGCAFKPVAIMRLTACSSIFRALVKLPLNMSSGSYEVYPASKVLMFANVHGDRFQLTGLRVGDLDQTQFEALLRLPGLRYLRVNLRRFSSDTGAVSLVALPNARSLRTLHLLHWEL